MDELRHQQLLAAAEAVRIWVHAQRASWSDDYPRALAERRLQIVASELPTPAPAPALALEPAVAFNTMLPTAPSIGLRDRIDAVMQPLRAASSRIGSFVRQSWLKAAIAVVLIVAATGIRAYWTDVSTTLTSNLAAGRKAVASGRRTLIEASNPKGSGTEPGDADSPKPLNPSAGLLHVETNPTGTRVFVDGRERGVTPLTLNDLTAGSHKVELRAVEGSIQRTVSITRGQTTQLNERIFSGWLHVSSPIELQISEARKALRLDDRNQVLLPPGSHEIRFENTSLGFLATRNVDVRPGETTSITLEPKPSALSVTASETAVVTVDGERAGETPLVDFPIKLGTRDVTITNATGEVRRKTLTVTTQPIQLDVDFSQP